MHDVLWLLARYTGLPSAVAAVGLPGQPSNAARKTAVPVSPDIQLRNSGAWNAAESDNPVESAEASSCVARPCRADREGDSGDRHYFKEFDEFTRVPARTSSATGARVVWTALWAVTARNAARTSSLHANDAPRVIDKRHERARAQCE
ncbi:MAG: hypothetical protein ABI606_09455 [Rhodoferax sp.]